MNISFIIRTLHPQISTKQLIHSSDLEEGSPYVGV